MTDDEWKAATVGDRLDWLRQAVLHGTPGRLPTQPRRQFSPPPPAEDAPTKR